jgi:hypothetical protein
MDSIIARGKLLRVSSEDKSVGENNANFKVILGNTSFVQNVRGIVLKNLSFKHVFPNVFYDDNVTPGTGNSLFAFSFNGVTEQVIIPAGWYSAEDYRVALETAINALPAVINPITITLPSVPAGSTLTKKFVFTATAPDTLGLINKQDGNTAADLMGISTTTGQALSQTSDFLPDFGGLSTIYLCSGILAGNNAAASSNSGEPIPLVIAIPLKAGFGQEVYYESKDPIHEAIIFRNDRNINSVDLALCTRLGKPLSLQQNNLTATFRIIHAGRLPAD